MRVLVIVKADRQTESGALPTKEAFEQMERFNEELQRAGVLLNAQGLRASSNGARVRFSGSKRTVIDGPFAEAKELVGGFWLWQVGSLAEAIEWVKRCPNPCGEGEWNVEIRPLFEESDFANI